MRKKTQTIGWYSNDLIDQKKWIIYLNKSELNLVKKILEKITSNESKKEITSLLFSKFTPIIHRIFDAAINQYGFLIVKGFPIPNDNLNIDVLSQFYLYFCQLIGVPLIQNKKGNLLFNIKTMNYTMTDPNGRGANHNNALPLHADHGGLLGMYCLHTAEIGGHTLLGSTQTIHDSIAAERLDLLKILYQPFYGDRRGQEPDGKLPYDINPIFKKYNDKLLCQYVGIYYYDAQIKFQDIPRMTQSQLDALNMFAKISAREEINFEVKLEPGDMIFINNNKVLHGRTTFLNKNIFQKTRHLLRIWLSTPQIKSFPHYYGHPIPSWIRIYDDNASSCAT